MVVSSRAPWIWVSRLWATSVSARITAIRALVCVPIPIVRSSGSFRSTSSATAAMVGMPISLVISRTRTSTWAFSNLSCMAVRVGSVILATHGPVSREASTSDQASRSITSERAWKTASSKVLPEARPLVFVRNRPAVVGRERVEDRVGRDKDRLVTDDIPSFRPRHEAVRFGSFREDQVSGIEDISPHLHVRVTGRVRAAGRAALEEYRSIPSMIAEIRDSSTVAPFPL